MSEITVSIGFIIFIVPLSYFLQNSPALSEPVEAVQELRALRYEEQTECRNYIQRKSEKLEAEPVLGDVAPVDAADDQCDHVEDEQDGAHLVLPLGLHVLADVDVGPVVDADAQKAHDEAEHSGEGQAAGEDGGEVDRDLDRCHVSEGPFAAEDVRDTSDREAAENCTHIVNGTYSFNLLFRHTHQIQSFNPVFKRVH